MADEFRNSPAGKKLLALMNDTKMASMIGHVLAEVVTELADAYAERDHAKAGLKAMRAELLAWAKIALYDRPDRKVVITKSMLDRVPLELKLHYEQPDENTRVYQLVDREPELDLKSAVGKILMPGGNA